MTQQERRALQSLDIRLKRLFQTSATQATQNHAAALQRATRFEERLSQGLFPEMSASDIARARQNYALQALRQEGIVNGIMQDMARTGDLAGEMIRGEQLNIFRQGYNAIATGLQRQMGNVGLRVDWGFYNREQLQILLENSPESPFTKVAYRNLGLGNERFRRAVENKLRETLAEAIVLGEGMPDITRRIQAITGGEYYKARRIARTETLRVANQGRYEAAKQAIDEYGIIATKVWVSTVDDRVRDDHADMKGAEAGEDGYFVLPNGEKALHPLDPDLSAEQSINCRCSHLYRIPQSRESQAYRDLKARWEEQNRDNMPTAEQNKRRQQEMMAAQRGQ